MRYGLFSMENNEDKGLLERRLRTEMRRRGLAKRTEDGYVGWYKRFVKFHKMRHPEEMGKDEVEAFLSYLAMEREVAASTQGQGEIDNFGNLRKSQQSVYFLENGLVQFFPKGIYGGCADEVNVQHYSAILY